MSKLSSGRPAGRPTGSAETPASLLRRGMGDSSKLAARARTILESHLTRMEKALENNNNVLDPDDLVTIANGVVSIMQALDKTVESAGKLLINPKDPRVDDSGENVDVLGELMSGGRK